MGKKPPPRKKKRDTKTNAVKVPTKQEKKVYSSRLKRFQEAGILHSQLVRYPRENKTIMRLLSLVTKRVYEHYFHDDLKAPMNNGAKSAFFSKTSLNVYFGKNQATDKQTVDRAAYGQGSGVLSIGINPNTIRIYPFFSELSLLEERVRTLVNQNTVWRAAMMGRDFNSVLVKVYFAYPDWEKVKGKSVLKTINKTTEWHTDIDIDSNGIPLSKGNSQVPGTPVAFLTFGDTKNLWFQRHSSKTHPIDNSLVHFLQKSGSLFVLDARDELYGENGWHWKHKSNMAVSEGITFSLMFRIVQTTKRIDPNTSRLAEPKVGPKKKIQFEKGQKQLTTKFYHDRKTDLDRKLKDFFDKNNNSNKPKVP